tara:strand:+ start:7652 stop:8920 length:1269 start_codon:yes stop_codon:yes gene_type:complete
MITKNYKSIFSYFAAATISLLIVSCDQEENTGYSTLVPTSPTLSLTTAANATLIEDNSVFEFTATLSTAQLVDTKLSISQIGGDATIGDDFTVDGGITIPAGATSATGAIKILSDELKEDTETVKIQIGDNTTANAALTPVTMEFTILNYTEGDLVIDMGWAASSIATTDDGEEIDATDFADLRLLISSTPDNAGDIGGADGGSFETFVLNADTPDGDYYVVADFYAASDIVRDIDLNLEFNQVGLINGSAYSYPAAISNLGTCSLNYYVMTKITKSGNSYAIEDIRTQSYSLTEVKWIGTDVDYDSQVSTNEDCEGKIIKGLNTEWMLDWWGEIVVDAGNVYYTVDGAGIVTIESQFLYTTTYNGAVQDDYYIDGTGTYDAVTGELYIEYHLIQDGWDLTAWMLDKGYSDTPYFIADLTII